MITNLSEFTRACLTLTNDQIDQLVLTLTPELRAELLMLGDEPDQPARFALRSALHALGFTDY